MDCSASRRVREQAAQRDSCDGQLQWAAHAAVVIAASVRDSIFFTVAPKSILARNVAANDRIALSVCDSQHAIMGQGRAVRVGPALELGALIAELADASQAGKFTPEGWDGDIYRVVFRRLFAN